MAVMTDDEAYAFIDRLPARTAKLATVRRDGSPHVAPIWVALDGGDLMFNTGRDTAKGTSLRRDPRISMCFDDDTPPFAFVVIEATVIITEDLDDVARWAAIIGGRYMGQERAEEYGRRNGVPGELLVRATPSKIIAVRDLAD